MPLTVEDCGGAGGPLSCVSSLTAKSSSSLSSSSSASGLPSACTSVTGLQMQQTEYRIHTTFVDCYVRGKTPAQNAVIVSALSRMSEILRTWSEHVSTMRVESASRPGCLQRSLMPDGGWQWLLRTCTGPAGPTPLPSPTLLPPNKAAKSASSPVGPGGSPESFIVYIISHFSSWRQKCAAPWLERLADGLGSGLASQLRLVQWQCTAHLEAGREAAPRATGHCATLELAAAAASPEEPLAAVALVAHHYRRSAHAYVLLRQACRVKPIASGNYSAGSQLLSGHQVHLVIIFLHGLLLLGCAQDCHCTDVFETRCELCQVDSSNLIGESTAPGRFFNDFVTVVAMKSLCRCSHAYQRKRSDA